jgi:hypothetical protein
MENKSINVIKRKAIPVLKRNNVVRAGIFGSFARGEETRNSDIDILIKTNKPLGFNFMKIQFELEKKIGREVDLLTYNSIHPLLKKRILNEEIRII